MSVQIGDIKGQLQVVGIQGNKVKLQCLCRNTIVVDMCDFETGKYIHCGCRDKLGNDLCDKRIGNWEVIGYLGNGKYAAKCLLCGKIKSVGSYDLASGKSTSCGCNSTGFKDLSHKMFGYWEVIDYAGNQMWNCRCTLCNNIKKVKRSNLVNGLTKSCGCTRKTLDGAVKIEANAIIGDYELLERVEGSYTKWECRCTKCYDIQIKDVYNMRKGVGCTCSKCGVQNEKYGKHKPGEVYGDMSLVEYIPDKHGYWLMECIKCGRRYSKHLQSVMKGLGDKCNSCKQLENKDKPVAIEIRPKIIHAKAVDEYKEEYGQGFNGDLTGNKYGDIEVGNALSNGKYICRCRCGKQYIATKYTLESWNFTNCGCNKTDRIVAKDTKYRDAEFGDWLVNKFIGNNIAECTCRKCGNTKRVKLSNLLNGSSTSCGCEKYREDLSGKIIGTWKVNKWLGDGLWECQCNRCGTVDSSTTYMLKSYNKICKTCNPDYHSSYETELADLFKGATTNDRKVLNGKELDLYFEDKKLAIEFNGNYWHCSYVRGKNYHRDKTLSCLEKGIRLIHIFEYEWNDEEKKRKIIDLINGILDEKTNNKVYARETEVKEIDKDEASEFIEKYHIQGNTRAKVYVGLYKEKELIGAMSFGIPRFDKDADWELIRLVYKSGYNVVGGTEKMFKYFLDKYKPNNVLSYCDISKFDGGVYKRLGFKFKGYSQPNYVWINPSNGNVLSRYKTMRNKLIHDLNLEDKPELTENDIMDNLGYVKIYDCGNAKYLFERT